MSALRCWQTLLAGAILLLGMTVWAEPPLDRVDPRDIEIALYARRALSQDSAIAGLHLGVTVREGVATVWGVAPTWEIAERALEIVRKVRGVYAIRNQIRLGGELTEEALRHLLGGLAEAGAGRVPLPTVEPPPERPGILPDAPMKKPLEVINAQPPHLPTDAEPPTASGVRLLAPIVVSDAAPSRSTSVRLLQPLSVSTRDRTAPVPLPVSSTGLLAEAERLRDEDDRYRGVRIEVSDGEVTLSGRVVETEHLIELARALSHLPGVVRVDTRAVRTR